MERISNMIETKIKEISAITDDLDKLEAEGELKRNELELKAKNIEIEKLKEALENVEYKSDMAGVIKEVNPEGGGDNFTGSEKPFMTIITLGNYSVKGKLNEQIKENLIGAGHNNVEIKLSQGETDYQIEQGNPEGVMTVTYKVKEKIRNIDGVVNATFYKFRRWGANVSYKDKRLESAAEYGADTDFLKTKGYIIKEGRNL